MNVTRYSISIAFLCSLLGACAPAENPLHPVDDQRFTAGWQFMSSDTALDLAAARASDEWVMVDLPHRPDTDPPVSVAPDPMPFFQGDSWYRKTISYSPAWQGKQISLVFEAAMGTAEIWLNGDKITTHTDGYLPFRINLTDRLSKDAPNELLIRLDNRDNPLTASAAHGEQQRNHYGGLYRPVYLHIENNLAITDPISANKPGSGGINVSYPEITRERALIDIQTHVANAHYDPKQYRIVQRLMWGDKVVTDQGSKLLLIEGHSEEEQTLQLVLPNPQLWSPRTPHLYRLVTRVYDGNSLVEEKSTRIGIRKFELMNGKLYINGEETYLRGVNRYQEYPFIGFATSAAADYRDAVQIKSAGFDAVYAPDYPQSTAFLDAADELGLIVLNTISNKGHFSEDPAFQLQAQQSCRDLIRRDRNHPSVLAWECSLGTAEASTDFINTMNTIVHEELPHGLTAANYPEPADIRLITPQELAQSGDDSNTAIWIKLDNADTYRNNSATNTSSINHPQAIAHTWGTMFSEEREQILHQKATDIMGVNRQPGYAYYFFQSQREPNDTSTQFESGPMVFIASDWTDTSPLTISVFSNIDEVELLLNGKSLGKKTQSRTQSPTPRLHPPFEFTLEKFTTGELKAVAYANKKIVAEHKVVTPGKSSSLRLRLNTAGKAPQTGVKDVLFVDAHLIDNKGNPVFENDIPLSFSLKGDATLISSAEVLTRKGTASALIEIGDTLEGLEVIAQTDNLPPARLSIQ